MQCDSKVSERSFQSEVEIEEEKNSAKQIFTQSKSKLLLKLGLYLEQRLLRDKKIKS